MIANLETLHANGTLAPVETIKINYGGEATRFNLVVVDDKYAVDTVTDQYSLVSNGDFVDSVDRMAGIVGLPGLSVSDGYVNTKNGKSVISLNIEDGGIDVPGDDSKSFKQILLENDYAGRGHLQISGGIERMICSNGMTVFETSASERRIHIGIEDLDEWTLETLSIFASKMNIFEALSTITAQAEFSLARSGLKIAETAPKRYRTRLEAALKDNAHSMGFNAWAAIQAVTEVATHDMKGTPTARKWSDKAIEAVLAEIGQTWETVEALA